MDESSELDESTEVDEPAARRAGKLRESTWEEEREFSSRDGGALPLEKKNGLTLIEVGRTITTTCH